MKEKTRKLLLQLSPFRKLKVFYQILIVIGLMAIFLIVEGLMGIAIIDSLSSVNRDVFSKSMMDLDAIQGLQADFNAIREGYLLDLEKNENNLEVTLTGTLRASITNRLGEFSKTETEISEEITQFFNEMEEILAKPKSIEQFEEISRIYTLVKSRTSSLSDKTKLLMIKTMEAGNRYSKEARRNTILFVFFGVLTATFIGFVIAIFIARSLKAVGLSAKALAAGDLTREIHVEGSIEVMEVIRSLNQAIISLRELVSGINRQSSVIHTASKELKHSAGDTSASAQEVTRAMTELASASYEQTNQVEHAVESVSQLIELVRQVSAEISSISTESEKVAESAQIGRKATSDVADEIMRIFEITQEVSDIMGEMDKTSEEIGEITTVIGGIAEQTTLLALNASIEAARAGEHGKGFAVVADETAKLAEQSKQAAQRISHLTEEMKSRTNKTVKTISSGIVEVELGKNKAIEATQTFESIFTKLNSILAQINSLAFSAVKMTKNNEVAMAAITNISVLSEESSANTQSVSAIVEEQSASIEEVSILAENLSEIAGALQKSVAVFEITKQ